MHILEIPSFFPPYGGAFCIDQSKALAAMGNTVRIVACVNISARMTPGLYLKAPLRAYKVEIQGIEVIRKEIRTVPPVRNFSPLIKYNFKRWVDNVEKVVDKYVAEYGRPDIIHAHCCKWAGYAAMLVGRKYGVPYVITEHLPFGILCSELGKPEDNPWQAEFMREAYHDAALVIPVAEEEVDDIAPYFGTDYKWKMVSNTIDTSFFAYRQRQPLNGRQFVFCCVADFIPRKGYDVLFEAVKRFRKELNGIYGDKWNGIKLVIAGRDTDSEEMKAMLKQNGLADCTEVCGGVDKYKVREILYSSDCFVLATRSEVQPLVLLEAMSTGIPVVSTEAIPRCERIEGACFISKTDDAVDFARQMRKVYDSTDICGKKISESIAAMASPAVVGNILNGLFDGVCKSFAGNKHLAEQ